MTSSCISSGFVAPPDEQDFSMLVDMINAMEVREDDETFKNPVDMLFDALEKRNPNHFALRQYKKFKLAAGKTAKSILVSWRGCFCIAAESHQRKGALNHKIR